MEFGFTHHALHLVLGKTAGGCDGDFLFASGCLIAGRDIENAVGIDVEGHLDLWHAAWSRSNTFETEVTQALVVARQFAFALQHMNLYRRLVILRRTEQLTLARRNGGVALD